jgi:hypothetical protein
MGWGIGGARRDRTADLLHAMQALSQLSYGPKQRASEEGAKLTRNPAGASPPKITVCGALALVDPPQLQGGVQGGLNGIRLNAASSLASVLSRPSRCSVWSIGGETAVPETATRSGCATFPNPVPSWFASSSSAA